MHQRKNIFSYRICIFTEVFKNEVVMYKDEVNTGKFDRERLFGCNNILNSFLSNYLAFHRFLGGGDTRDLLLRGGFQVPPIDFFFLAQHSGGETFSRLLGRVAATPKQRSHTISVTPD